MQDKRTKVLFLCTGNSARSILAEALLRDMAGDRFEVFSAGTEPKGVNPLTLKSLEEIGVSTAGLRSKNLSEYLGQQLFGYVIIVCSHAAESCPTVWPGAQHILHLFFDDPAAAEGSEEQRLQKFREVRDQIRSALQDFIAENSGTTHA